jgi:hypothetical protein
MLGYEILALGLLTKYDCGIESEVWVMANHRKTAGAGFLAEDRY